MQTQIVVRSGALQITALALIVVSCSARATDSFSGFIDVGGRNVEVHGDEAKYKQHVDLDSGARLFGLNIVFEPDVLNAYAPDRVEFSANGLGGDPYQNVRLGVRKYGDYRFTYERRQSDYFYEDRLIDPADEDPNASNGGDFHSFDFQRIRDKANLDINVTDRAKILLGFDRYSKKGESTTVLDVEREEFEMEQPIDQVLQNVDLGFEYVWDKATLSFNQRWRQFDDDVSIFLPGASEGSAPGAPTQLDNFFLEQPYGYDSRETQAGVVLRPTERWDVQANVLFIGLDMQVDALESVQGADFLGNPLQTFASARGSADQEIQQFYLSTGYALTERLRLTASVREQRLDQDAGVDFDGAEGLSDWKIDTTSFSLGAEAQFFDAWSLSGGWTADRRETSFEQVSDGAGRSTDEQSDRDGFYVVVGYRPDKRLSVSFSAEQNTIDDPFTLASATDTRRYRLKASYKWNNGLGMSGAYAWRQHENENSGWDAKSEQADLRLTYSTEPVTLSFGASFIDLDRSIAQQVQGGFRQDLFPIAYEAESDFWDGSARWHVMKRLDLMASYRRYQNDGSFDVEREDARVGADVLLSGNYRVGLNYRNVDYEEDFEDFDADIWELSVGLRW